MAGPSDNRMEGGELESEWGGAGGGGGGGGWVGGITHINKNHKKV